MKRFLRQKASDPFLALFREFPDILTEIPNITRVVAVKIICKYAQTHTQTQLYLRLHLEYNLDHRNLPKFLAHVLFYKALDPIRNYINENHCPHSQVH